MPQKRNPKLSQDIIAAAAQIRALVPLALDAMHTEHEADRTTSIMMGRALPRLRADRRHARAHDRRCSRASGVPGAHAREPRPLGGLIMAEALMLELGKQIGRQRAHDAVYEAAQGSVTQSRPFREMLAADEHVSARLTQAQVDALLDPARYSGLCRSSPSAAPRRRARWPPACRVASR
jgi:adenylosuccinate lyase